MRGTPHPIPLLRPFDSAQGERNPSPGDGFYSVGSWSFRFCLVWWGGGWRWKTPGGRCPCHTTQSESAVPIMAQRGFGRPGTVGRYRPAALKCSTHHGLIRAGCPGWLLRGWLHCAKASRGPGSSCRGRAGVICPTLPVRPGAGHTGGFEFGAEGHRGLLGSVRPLHEGT